jgi:predicted cupin superfamily sugar epimerase
VICILPQEAMVLNGMCMADALIETLGLSAHPEGGFFRRVYSAPFAYLEDRACGGSIYFLLRGGDVSHFHRIDCDELWYFHRGCGLRICCIDEAGQVRFSELGPAPEQGQAPMVLLPAGTIFAAENLDKAGFTLLSCATLPQFSYGGFTLFNRRELLERFPQHEALIRRLAMPDEDLRPKGE